ncbi:hypothetical protein L7F22_066256 [Adiantum nelumboides]|nr:hypothetical protein [Adiantum nelumboides]
METRKTTKVIEEIEIERESRYKNEEIDLDQVHIDTKVGISDAFAKSSRRRTAERAQRRTQRSGSNEAMVEDVQSKLSKEFEMKDLGELHCILGIEVSWLKKGDIFISQQKYLHSILDRFGMIRSKPVSTPMESTLKLTKDEHGVPYDATLYRQLIGSLIYLTITRSGTSFAVNTLAQYMQVPKVSHWIAAKRVLRKSISDNAFFLGTEAISWSSKKQNTISLSSTETEYKALTTSACESIWL